MEKRNDTGKARESVTQGKAKPTRTIEIPELYRLPISDRGKQGCMKARA